MNYVLKFTVCFLYVNFITILSTIFKHNSHHGIDHKIF